MDKAKRAQCARAARKTGPDKGDGRQLNAYGYGIIHGTTSLDNPNLQYKQPLPHLIAAIALAKIRHPLEWDKRDLDEIMVTGNNLISETLNYSQCPLVAEKLQIFDLNTQFSMRDRIITYSVEETDAKGQPAIRPGYIFDLEGGLKTFFMTNDFGVLILDDVKLAIWTAINPKNGKRMYFTYVPYPTGSTGRIKPGGLSSLLMLPAINLIYTYVKRITQRPAGAYSIYAIDMNASGLEDTGTCIPDESWSPDISRVDRHFGALFEPDAYSSMIEYEPSPSPEVCPARPSRAPPLAVKTGQMFTQFYPATSPLRPTPATTRIPVRQTTKPSQMFPQFYPAQSPIQASPVSQPAVCPRPSRQRMNRLTNKPSNMFPQYYPMQSPVQMPTQASPLERRVCPRTPAPRRQPARGPPRLTAQPGPMFSQFYPAQSPMQGSPMQTGACPRTPKGSPGQSFIPMNTLPYAEAFPSPMYSPSPRQQSPMDARVCPRTPQQTGQTFIPMDTLPDRYPSSMVDDFIQMDTLPFSQSYPSSMYPPSPNYATPIDQRIPIFREEFTPTPTPVRRKKPRSGFLQERAPMFPNFYPYNQSLDKTLVAPRSPQQQLQRQPTYAEPFSPVMGPTCPYEETPVFQRDVPRARRLFHKASPENYKPRQLYQESPQACPYQPQQNLFREKYRPVGRTTSAMFPEFINYSPAPACPY